MELDDGVAAADQIEEDDEDDDDDDDDDGEDVEPNYRDGGAAEGYGDGVGEDDGGEEDDDDEDEDGDDDDGDEDDDDDDDDDDVDLDDMDDDDDASGVEDEDEPDEDDEDGGVFSPRRSQRSASHASTSRSASPGPYFRVVEERRQRFLAPFLRAARRAANYRIEPIGAFPHAAHVHAMAQSADGSVLLTGGSDGHVRRYDVYASANGKNMLTQNVRHGFVEGINKGGALVSWWGNEEISAKDVERLNDYRPVSAVHSLACQKDALWCLSGTQSGNINLTLVRHDPGTTAYVLRKHTGAVSALALSHDESQLVSGGWDKGVHQWDLNTGQVVRSYPYHTGQISSISFRPLYAKWGAPSQSRRSSRASTTITISAAAAAAERGDSGATDGLANCDDAQDLERQASGAHEKVNGTAGAHTPEVVPLKSEEDGGDAGERGSQPAAEHAVSAIKADEAETRATAGEVGASAMETDKGKESSSGLDTPPPASAPAPAAETGAASAAVRGVGGDASQPQATRATEGETPEDAKFHTPPLPASGDDVAMGDVTAAAGDGAEGDKAAQGGGGVAADGAGGGEDGKVEASSDADSLFGGGSAEADGEADADGEEDAEGELDADGDAEMDAEGEADVDANGRGDEAAVDGEGREDGDSENDDDDDEEDDQPLAARVATKSHSARASAEATPGASVAGGAKRAHGAAAGGVAANNGRAAATEVGAAARAGRLRSKAPFGGLVGGVGFDADVSTFSDDVVLVSTLGGQVMLWDRRVPAHATGVGGGAQARGVRALALPERTPPWCACAAWSASGERIYVARRNETVDEWDVRMLPDTQRVDATANLGGHATERAAGAAAAAQRGSGDARMVRSLRLPTGSGPVSALAPFPNDEHLAVASFDNLRLFHVGAATSASSSSALDDRAERGGVRDAEAGATPGASAAPGAPSTNGGGHGRPPFRVVAGHQAGFVSQLLLDPSCQLLFSSSGDRGWMASATDSVVMHAVSMT